MKRLMTILAMVVIATTVSVVSKAQYAPQGRQGGTPLKISAVYLSPAVEDSANVVLVQVTPKTVVSNDSSFISNLTVKWVLGYVSSTGKTKVVLGSENYSAILPNTSTLADIKSRIQSFYPSGFITFR